MAGADEGAAELTVDPTLLQSIAMWDAAGHWAVAYDDQWRPVAVSDEIASSGGLADVRVGEFVFGPVAVEVTLAGRSGANTIDEIRAWFVDAGGWLLEDITGGRDALREMVHPALRDLVDDLQPNDHDAFRREQPRPSTSGTTSRPTTVYQPRIRDASGRLVGTLCVSKPGVGMTTIGMLAGAGDLGSGRSAGRPIAAQNSPRLRDGSRSNQWSKHCAPVTTTVRGGTP